MSLITLYFPLFEYFILEKDGEEIVGRYIYIRKFDSRDIMWCQTEKYSPRCFLFWARCFPSTTHRSALVLYMNKNTLPLLQYSVFFLRSRIFMWISPVGLCYNINVMEINKYFSLLLKGNYLWLSQVFLPIIE